MPSARDWFRFFRTQTAAITIPSTLIGYLLAGGSLWSAGALEWALFGLVFHIGGFADNNLQDVKLDVRDKNKDLFPLGRTMTLREGRIGTLILHVVGILYAIFLIHNLLVFILFGMMYAFGLLYNRTSKSSLFAGVWIGFCFGPLPLLSYLSTVGSYSPLILVVTIYGVLQTFFQNGLSGSMKDIEEDKYNPLKALKVRVTTETRHLIVPKPARYFVLGMKLVALIPLFYVILSTNGATGYIALLLFVAVLLITSELFRDQIYNHQRQIRRIVAVEILTFFAMLVALTPVIGWVAVLFIILSSVAWFVCWNRILWGSLLSPRV